MLVAMDPPSQETDKRLRCLHERAESALERLARAAEVDEPSVKELIADLRAAIGEAKEIGPIFGPLIHRLLRAQEDRRSMPSLRWIAIQKGHLSVGRRPRIRTIPWHRAAKTTHILTLLSELEGAEEIGHAAREAGIDWLWFPVPSGKPPMPERQAEMYVLFDTLCRVLDSRGRVHIHCAAGIHRTGMITYAFLRSLGMSPRLARDRLRALRPIMAERVGQHRLAWGDQFGPRAQQ